MASRSSGLFIVAAGLAVMFAGSTLLTPLYELYRQTFHFTELTVTLVYAVYAVGNVVALLLLGRLSDQLGRRRVALSALVLAAVCSALYLATPGWGPGWLFAGRTLSGLSVGVASGTATAWIVEFAAGDRTRASVIAASANFVGIALGPLFAGALAQYAPAPLQLTHLVYLGLLAVTAWKMAVAPETVRHPVHRVSEVSLRPRIGVPREIRSRFVSPAATMFAALALVGFYAALVPAVLKRDLHQPNLATGGLIVAAMFLSGAIGVWATRSLRSRRAALFGLVGMFVALGLLVLAEAVASMAALVAGTVIGGVAAAMSYRGGLQVVNEIAPVDRRAEVLSSYLLAGFLGNALPILGVGLLSQVVSPRMADELFSLAIAAVVLLALVAGLRSPPSGGARRERVSPQRGRLPA